MKLAAILERKGHYAVTVGESATIADAVKLMHENKVGSVLIATEHNEPVGIFTERDVLTLCAAGEGGRFHEMSIKGSMTAELTVGHPDDNLDDMLNVMTSNRFRRLPVVVDGKINGLLSLGDLVKARLEETEHDAEALREYIAS